MSSGVEYTGQYIREAPEIEALKLGLMTGARNFILGTDTTPGYNLAEQLRGVNTTLGNFIQGRQALPQLTAGLSGLQMDAIGAVNADIAAGQGIGGYQPYMQQAGQTLQTGTGLTGGAAANVAGMNVAGGYTPAQGLYQQGATQLSPLDLYEQQAASGMPRITEGAQGIQRAGQQVGDYLQADLGVSQGLLGQGAQAVRDVAADYGQARQAIGQGLGAAGQVAQTGMPAQTTAQSTLGMGLGTLAGATEGYDPSRASQFMNPYQQEVTRQALAEMRRQADIAENQAAAQAVRSGAFGGTREGVQRAEMERNVQDIMSQRIMQDYAQNYAQAQQAALQSFEAQQGRELGVGQAMGQLGGMQSQVGSQAANLLAQQAALQGQMGSQLGAITGQEAGVDLQRAQQLAAIGQLYGAQGLQQAQLGQAGSQLQGQLAAQYAQTGLLPAQIAAQQASIGGQQAQLYGQMGQGLGALAGQMTGQQLQQQQLLGQLAQQYGQSGLQMAQLGQLQQQAALGDINAMAQLGQIQQGTKQAEISAQQQSLIQQSMAPFQQYAFISDIYKNAPSSQMSLTQASAPQASTAQQIAGLAGAAISGGKALGAF